MRKEIIINSAINDTRVAITEDGELAEFFIELPSKERFIGNIYYGRVNRIVTGLNAAFIDIGLNQDAFLHFSDIEETSETTFITEEEDSEEIDNELNSETLPLNDITETEVKAPKKKKGGKKKKNETEKNDIPAEPIVEKSEKAANNPPATIFKTKRSGDVQINLTEGQYILVQVTREAYASKGMKVTSKIALPGRYVVLLPFDNMLGVSKKITSFQERRRIRGVAKSFLPKGAGCIIRTASRGKSEEELKKDWLELLENWSEIETKYKSLKAPGLVYQDMQLATSVIRDLFTSHVQKVATDSKKLYKEIINYLQRVSPHLESKVELYNGKKGIFEEYGIERDLAKTYKRRVNLKSGGDIVIEHTEAMTVIDVNSGKSTEKEQEKSAFKTNLEAMIEIARQIRLRDLGGMILVDFIDMSEESNRKKLFFEMKRELGRDRAKTVAYPLTQLGIMQITRQRINQNISEKITESCPLCKGTGRVTSKAVIINEIERWLKNFRKNSNEFRLILNVHPNIAEYIADGTISSLSKLMIKYFVKIKLQQNETLAIDSFRFFSVRHQKDITSDYI